MDGWWGTFCSIWVRGAGVAVRRSDLDKRRRGRFELRSYAVFCLLEVPCSLALGVDAHTWMGT